MTRMGKWAQSGRAGVQIPPLTLAVALGVSIPQLPQFSTRAQNSYRYRCCTTWALCTLIHRLTVDLVPRLVFAEGRILPCERGFRVDVLLKKRPAQGYWA